jgi:hypothetical protein
MRTVRQFIVDSSSRNYFNCTDSITSHTITPQHPAAQHLVSHVTGFTIKKTHSITQQEEQPVTSNTHAHGGDHILITKATVTEAQQFPQL